MLDDVTRTEVIAAIERLPLHTEIAQRDSATIILTQTLSLTAAPAEVWAHLTEPEKLIMWSPVVPDRPLTAPGPAECRENPEDDAVVATVLTVEEERLLIHRWGPGTVSWALAPVDSAGHTRADSPGDASADRAGHARTDAAGAGGTELRLEQQFASAEEAAMTAAGWHICLAMLELVLSSRPVQRVVGMEAMEVGWESLRDAYVAMI